MTGNKGARLLVLLACYMYTGYTCPSLPDIADAGELAEVALAVVVGPSRASAPKLTHNITHHSSLSHFGVWS